ncbi:hypothetical protein BKP35_17320 [Anaerobacillus arseniciselenatis]|uniref:NERD domain-containing protein n=1 Tax=Anaerobacillus arseniciselenatis TaxID=85682 RepID=A0A1S2LAQ6_9BACI|nr:nuclease-related domain-containing protein [Anaerobacillus arseniciselenatis]OIJ08847.1 hypothetical protein BKP35_17320 [Anaerobacillus arseniciselenatis]
MFFKTRREPLKLKIFKSLNARDELVEKDVSYYRSLQKGYEGEKIFDKWLVDEGLPSNFPILNDLLFEVQNTKFQIDSSLISSDTLYLFEVKNFDGDYVIKGDQWYSLSGTEIKNPLHQLKRSETLFRKLLQEFGFNLQVKAYLVFVNPDFLLYQAPLKEPIIFPSQLKRFLGKLNTNTLPLRNRHSKLPEKLLANHLIESPYSQLPSYSYEKLEKGILCGSCNSFLGRKSRSKVICELCGVTEDVDSAVLRSIEEFRLLFPEEKITTSTIKDWCKIIDSSKMLRRILKENFKLVRYSNYSYYIDER